MIKLIISWLIVISLWLLITHDKGIYYADPYMEQCVPNYMGSCD